MIQFKNSVMTAAAGMQDFLHAERSSCVTTVGRELLVCLVSLFLIASVLSLSPPLGLLLVLPKNFVFIICCALYLVLTPDSWWESPIYLALLMLISTFVSAVLAGNVQYLKYSLYVCLALLVISKTNHHMLERISDVLNKFVVLGLALSILSFILNAVWPIEPSFVLENPDGRENGLYYFTFTNFVLPSAIRPAFVFDEPGTFSFVVCVAAILRDILKKNKFVTGVILLLGLITFSLPQVVVLVLYLILNLREKKVRWLLIAVFALWCAVFFLLPAFTDVLDFFVSRFDFDPDGGLSGDNRSGQMKYFFEILNDHVLFFGMPECFDGEDICSNMSDLGSNPFTPISSYGLIVAWPFYLMLLMLVFAARLAEFRFAAIALVFLLLQRPFLFSFGYSLLIVMCVAPIFSASFKFFDAKPRFRAIGGMLK